MSVDPSDDRLLVHLCQRAHLSARTSLVAPKLQEFVNLLYRKAEQPGALNKTQLVNVALVKEPVAIRMTMSRTE